MYNEKPCIALIFDKSYIIYDLQVPLGIIFTIMNHNKDAFFIYGGIPRLCRLVEENIPHLKLNPNNYVKIELPSDPRIIKSINARWFNSVLEYHPDKIFLFRDNSHSTETSMLVNNAAKEGIPVLEFDERGQTRQMPSNSPDLNPYFFTKTGRAPYYDF